MIRHGRIWQGLTSVFAILLSFMIGFTAIAFVNAGPVNNAFGINTNAISNSGQKYYESDYGELNDENCFLLISDETAFTVQQMEEGSVLLKNDGILPLQASERNITLFGRASVDICYRSSCSGPQIDPNRLVDLKMAFEEKGFSINETLYNAYKNSSTSPVRDPGTLADIGEEPLSFYSSDIKSSFSNYKDAAVIVLRRSGGEGNDLSVMDKDGVPELSLHTQERELIEMVREEGFDKIIVLINSIYPMEVDWLDELGVNACLWIGNPGYHGLPGVVNLLTGAATPSGHLVDTYAASSLSSPAMQNFGDLQYANNSFDTLHNAYVVYAEGIYKGYKYYETRYEDSILNQGNADGDAGIFASKDNKWSYSDEVSYPFGYGLSYTDFSQSITSAEYIPSTDQFKVEVLVSNIGDTYAGKSAVQLYAQQPYTQYDIDNKVEKSAVVLVGYGKTSLLQPGESETVSITVDRYLLASYDYTSAKRYILDAGNYYFAIGDNVHDALNNILAAKGASGMYDQDGVPVNGDKEKVWVYDGIQELDTESYRNSPYIQNSEYEVTNLFDDADINYYYDDPVVTYLSRSDWQSTFPQTVSLDMNSKIAAAMKSNVYEVSSSGAKIADVITGSDKGIPFSNMVGVPFDDPSWTVFIQQLSVEDLCILVSENYGNKPVSTVSKPSNTNGEGPEGCSGKYKFGTKNYTTGYAGCPVTAASWNPEIATGFGKYFGEDCLYSNMTCVFGPGADLHRTPYGGRAAEYYSEDPVMTYLCTRSVTGEMARKGVITTIKHFVANDQETNRTGVSTFFTEQDFRENCLRAFEGAIASGNAKAIMTSFNRIGCTASGLSKALLTDLLRGEWGFVGFTMTDAVSESSGYCPTPDALIAGTEMFVISDRTRTTLSYLKNNDDGYILQKLQEANHRILYTLANSLLVNGLEQDTKVSVSDAWAWWQYALVAVDIFFGLLLAASAALYIIQKIKSEKPKEAILSLKQNKGISSWLLLLAAILSVGNLIYGVITKGLIYNSFQIWIIVSLAVGTIASLAAIVLSSDLAYFLPIPFIGAALALQVYDAAPVMADKYNGINFVQGNFTHCIIYLICVLLCAAMICIATFLHRKHTAKSE